MLSVCVASVFRLYYLIVLQSPTAEKEEDLVGMYTSSFEERDILLLFCSPASDNGIGKIVLWSAIEPLVGITCACLPTLGHVFRQRTLQSILRSLGSFFDLHSRQSTKSRHSESKTRPLNDQHNLATTVVSHLEDTRSSDIVPLQSIVVTENGVQQRPL